MSNNYISVGAKFSGFNRTIHFEIKNGVFIEGNEIILLHYSLGNAIIKKQENKWFIEDKNTKASLELNDGFYKLMNTGKLLHYKLLDTGKKNLVDDEIFSFVPKCLSKSILTQLI